MPGSSGAVRQRGSDGVAAEQPAIPPAAGDRWDRIGRIAGYTAALALAPYPAIKASWVVGSLVGLLPVGAGFSKAGWVLLNTVTIGMSVAGIAVALALARPWGLRVPGRPLAFCAWVAAGFLVPLLPFAVLSSFFVSSDTPRAKPDPAAMPGWEAVLIQIGFVGMGLGLAVGLPAYLRRRWPGVFSVRLDGDPRQARGQRSAALAATAVGLVWLSWAVGSPLGVTHTADRVAAWRILNGFSGAWALVTAIAVVVLQRRTPARLPRWLPVAAAWIGSGSLFAWSGWKLVLTLYLLLARPDDTSLPENLIVAALLHTVAIAAGAAIAKALTSRRGMIAE